MVSDVEDGKGLGQFSVQGRAEAHGVAASAREIRYLVIPFVGSNNKGGRDRSDLDVNPLEVEYGRAIYCDASDSGPM